MYVNRQCNDNKKYYLHHRYRMEILKEISLTVVILFIHHGDKFGDKLTVSEASLNRNV